MTKKKNKILTFIFSLIPGAGEMYMGFMKQGLSLMSMFFASIMLAVWIRVDGVLLISVVIWFYSFFHAHNLRALSDERFQQEKDKLILPLSGEEPVLKVAVSNGRLRNVGAVALIFVGAVMLWDSLLAMIGGCLPYWMSDVVWQITYKFPEVAVSILIIWLGIRLIRGKKNELLQELQNVQIRQEGQENSATQDVQQMSATQDEQQPSATQDVQQMSATQDVQQPSAMQDVQLKQ